MTTIQHLRTCGPVLMLISLGCGSSSLSTSSTDASMTTVPNLGTVTVQPGRGSAVLTLPAVAGAVDYRAFASAHTDGGVLYCAGYQQHSAPLEPPEIVRKIELDGITEPTDFVVEAIDTPCPF